MLDRNIEDTRQPDESRYSDYGFECEKCGKDDLTVDEVYDVIIYPHGITRGMVTKTVCEECHYNIEKYGWYFEDAIEAEDASDEGQVRDALDYVREFEENEE